MLVDLTKGVGIYVNESPEMLPDSKTPPRLRQLSHQSFLNPTRPSPSSRLKVLITSPYMCSENFEECGLTLTTIFHVLGFQQLFFAFRRSS